MTDALSDTWLQVRAKPLIYILIWSTLALAPYFLLGLAFQKPIAAVFDELYPLLEQMDVSGIQNFSDFPEGYFQLYGQLLRIYAFVNIIVAFITVYMTATIAGTVSRFRDRAFPTFIEALNDGAHIFPRFLISVFYAVFRILLRSLVIGAAALLLTVLTGSLGIVSFSGFLVFFIFLSDLNRYGLAPFIHLSLETGARDSSHISKAFFMARRPVVAGLFMALVILPVVFLMTLFTLFLATGFLFTGGSFVIWFITSILQFGIVMTLINFARNTFIKTEAAGGTEAEDIEGGAEPAGTGNPEIEG